MRSLLLEVEVRIHLSIHDLVESTKHVLSYMKMGLWPVENEKIVTHNLKPSCCGSEVVREIGCLLNLSILISMLKNLLMFEVGQDDESIDLSLDHIFRLVATD